jgi:hypothetical protein
MRKASRRFVDITAKLFMTTNQLLYSASVPSSNSVSFLSATHNPTASSLRLLFRQIPQHNHDLSRSFHQNNAHNQRNPADFISQLSPPSHGGIFNSDPTCHF